MTERKSFPIGAIVGACCGCGLVHDIVFATKRSGQEIGVAAKVNKRATAARRRAKIGAEHG